jgi:primosomal protein N' (replication factor Y)
MSQVSGRAGRKNSRGKVIIQTSSKNNPIIHYVVNHDYQSMFADQIEERRRFRYPPFSRLIEIILKHRDVKILDSACELLAHRLRQLVDDTIMGPEYPLISKIQNLHLKKMLVKIEKGTHLTETKKSK